MDKKKIQKLIAKAKQTYSSESEKYDTILTYQGNYIRNNASYNQQQYTENTPQEAEMLPGEPQTQMQQPQAQQEPRINVIGNPDQPQAPINIIAKNYISPESFDEDDAPKKKVIKKKSVQLAKIPSNVLKSSSTEWEPINFRGINVSYDLYEFSKVHIKYDEKEQKVIYEIIEPELTETELGHYNELKRGFIYVFERIASEEIDGTPREIIVQGAKRLCAKYRLKIDQEELEKLIYFLKRDFLGLEIIEPLMHDPFIEDISCDGLGIPIFVNHLKYGPLEVNRKYKEGDKLNSFIVKLAQKSNQEVSLSRPILQGALPDGSRVEAIYGKEVSEKGSSFTLRKFRAEPFTPIHLIEFGTMPPFLLAYLWLSVENKQSLLISGGTATGKTTILNALSLFVPPSSKIVSIEDTPEINLPHEHWLPMISRESNEKSEVSMFDLLKASLRERPDFIIVGEIRGAEAAILFQGMATGHAGLGTVHADKFVDLVNRMTIKPINLPKQLLTELDIVVFMKQFKIQGNVVRRCSKIVEVIDYNAKNDEYETNDFVIFKPSEDEFDFSENSGVISNLIKLRGGSEDALWNEIEKRRRILDIMAKKKITEFRDVSDVIKTYYKEPSAIFDHLEKLESKEKKE